ncbi:uncharacterized protein LOC132619620 [Lycium barbarum]|uniref:uncharacterized protein LOC132619620 n=1 Tax=Lycium barbarum TaxID=112863 RepID=UPI00293EA005|nr:uncharacterized protein LOC132619620 [Lycium barbarum]
MKRKKKRLTEVERKLLCHKDRNKMMERTAIREKIRKKLRDELKEKNNHKNKQQVGKMGEGPTAQSNESKATKFQFKATNEQTAKNKKKKKIKKMPQKKSKVVFRPQISAEIKTRKRYKRTQIRQDKSRNLDDQEGQQEQKIHNLDTAAKYREPIQLFVEQCCDQKDPNAEEENEVVEETPRAKEEDSVSSNINRGSKKSETKDQEETNETKTRNQQEEDLNKKRQHKRKDYENYIMEESSNTKYVSHENERTSQKSDHGKDSDTDYIEDSNTQRGRSKSKKSEKRENSKKALSQGRRTKADTAQNIQ